MSNQELAISTDMMDLDDSMPLMSPCIPLTTILEFPDEDNYDHSHNDDDEEEGDYFSRGHATTSHLQHRSAFAVKMTTATATAAASQEGSILITRSVVDGDELPQDDRCEDEEGEQVHDLLVLNRTASSALTPGVGAIATTKEPSSLGGRSTRLSINLSFLSPSSPSSVSCSPFSPMSSVSSSSPPSASYSSSSSAMSSPGGAISPILNPFQWTSDLRQYIMTDIGPQPSNSQVPALRSHLHLVRRRSYSKIGGTGFGGAGLGGGLNSPSAGGGLSPLSPSSSMTKGFGMGMGIGMSPTMQRKNSLQTQALVGHYGNGNVMMTNNNNSSNNNNGNSNSSGHGDGSGAMMEGGSSFYGGVYQQRFGSSSMTDLATHPLEGDDRFL